MRIGIELAWMSPDWKSWQSWLAGAHCHYAGTAGNGYWIAGLTFLGFVLQVTRVEAV